MNEQLFNVVKDFLLRKYGEEYGLEADEITPETELISLDFDSLDVYDIVTVLGMELNKEVPENKILQIRTVQDLVNCFDD